MAAILGEGLGRAISATPFLVRHLNIGVALTLVTPQTYSPADPQLASEVP